MKIGRLPLLELGNGRFHFCCAISCHHGPLKIECVESLFEAIGGDGDLVFCPVGGEGDWGEGMAVYVEKQIACVGVA